jgi:signal transduction histidine kinase/ligand-binding sensor domain-containing protein
MYFITYGGLSVYDGARFTNYGKQNGLANELVNDVIEILPDSFLVATNVPSLNTLVHGKIGNHITVDHFYPTINKFLKCDDGFLYVTADEGLFKFVDNRFVRLPFLTPDRVDIGLNLDKITVWKNFFIILPWTVKQPERLFLYDYKKQSLVLTYTEKMVFSTAVDADGVVWMSTSHGIEKLDTNALLNGRIKGNTADTDPASNPLKNAGIYFDDDGNAWIYAFNQITFMSRDGEERVIASAQGLETSYLSDVFVDREGITWMASEGNGVIKMPGTNLQVFKTLKPGIVSNVSVLEQQADTIWLFNVADHSFYRIHADHSKSFPLPKSFTKAVAIYIQGNALYFSDRKNMYRVAHKDLISSYQHPEVILAPKESVIEVGSGIIDPFGGIIQAIQEADTSFYLSVILDQQMYMQSRIHFLCDQMAFDKNNLLWVPTRDDQLQVFSLHPEDPAHYLRLVHDFSTDIEGLSPRSVTIDTTGNIWIGTRYQGIYQYQWKGNQFKPIIQLTTTQGLTDNFNYYLYCDPYNQIWAGSQTGLDKISIKNGKYVIENITKSKNIFQGIYKIIHVEKNVYWALSSNGDRIVISSAPSENLSFTPTFFITRISVNGKEMDQSVSRFSHDHNNFSIHLAAPSFLDEKAVRYSYMLQGSGGDKWSDPSNHAIFDLINLAPGTYRLNIKADFPAERYPSQTLLYSFTIRPPFWSTWWFISAVILLLLILLGSLVRYYYARKLENQKMILEKKQALEKERTRIATDMHDDLGAGLSRIKFLCETIGIKQQQHLPIQEEINTIRHYSHDMIDKMGEIVWALNEKNDSLSDLLSYTRAYSMEYLAENGIESQIDKLPPIGMVMVNSEFRRNIYLSVKETLHNVIKHALAHKVIVQFRITDKLVISIMDNGVGFDENKIQHFGNGLNNIRKRMTELGGSVEIIEEQGTKVVLTAPLPT